MECYWAGPRETTGCYWCVCMCTLQVWEVFPYKHPSLVILLLKCYSTCREKLSSLQEGPLFSSGVSCYVLGVVEVLSRHPSLSQAISNGRELLIGSALQEVS